MIECPYCYRVFRQPPDKLGARCPKCRMPLYEDPAKRRKNPEQDHGSCSLHPDAAAVTVCSRCEKPVCRECRTRWQEEVVCPVCIDQSIADDEPSPQEAQMQTKQAWVSVVLALSAWMLMLLTLGPMATFHQSPISKTMVFFAYACFLGSFIPGVFGLGNAIAATRLRGDHAKLALCGLIAAGAQLGIGIGLIVINLWHN